MVLLEVCFQFPFFFLFGEEGGGGLGVWFAEKELGANQNAQGDRCKMYKTCF